MKVSKGISANLSGSTQWFRGLSECGSTGSDPSLGSQIARAQEIGYADLKRPFLH